MTRLVRIGFAALVAFCLAAPASAVVVSFTSNGKAGLGTGGISQIFGTQTSAAPNGLPICQKGLSIHLNASVPAAGFAELGTSAPRSLMAVRPFKYGTAGAVGANGTRAGVAGVNGAAQYSANTGTAGNNGCRIAFTSAFLQGLVKGRTQTSFLSAPAQFQISTTTAMQPAGLPRAFGVIGALENHTLAAGAGPGTFVQAATMTLARKAGGTTMGAATAAQSISGMAGGATFGGGWRASGGGVVNLVVVNPFTGGMSTGFWNSGPRFGGHSKGGPLFGTQTGMFFNTMLGMSTTVTLRVWNGAFTTGTVMGADAGGAFVTARTIMGADNRTGPMSSMGTLQVVAPFTASLSPFLGGASNLYFSGSAETIFTFLPEPGPTAAMAAGVSALVLLHVLARRRK